MILSFLIPLKIRYFMFKNFFIGVYYWDEEFNINRFFIPADSDDIRIRVC